MTGTNGAQPSAVAGACPPDGTRAAAWRGARRVLAVRLDNLGDLLMTTPALAALRDGLPGAEITLLASPGSVALAPHLPMVDRVWPFAAPWMPARADAAVPADGAAEAALVQRLRDARFDAAVIFTVCTQSALPAALLCRLAGIPLRLAVSRENPYGLLSDWVPERDQVGDGMRHEVQRQLDLVASVGLHTGDQRLRFAMRAADRRQVAERLAAAGIAPGAPYAVLHPGATAPSRRWPADRFGAVGRALADRAGCAVAITGDAGDAERVAQTGQAMASHALQRPVAEGRGGGSCMDAVQEPLSRRWQSARGPVPAPVLSLAGALSLGELAALIAGARIVVCNNSLAAHLAAAVGTPVLALYALTNPQHTPWRVPARVLSHDVACRWCLKSTCPQLHHDCLQQVTAAQAADAALALLRDTDADTRTAATPAARTTAPAPATAVDTATAVATAPARVATAPPHAEAPFPMSLPIPLLETAR